VELSGKLAVITGASRGIGRALAKEFVKSGCSLLLTAYEEDELTALSDELRVSGSQVNTMASDLSDIESRTRLVRWIIERDEKLDLLVNNAGMGGDFGKFEFQSLKNIDKTIAVNISAFVHLTHQLISVLKSRPRAKIVNISSGMARLPYPGLAVYGATKAFVSSFSESLGCELASTRVDVLCFHPGFTKTPFLITSRMDMHRIPRIMLHTPEEIADCVVRAIRRDARWAYSDILTHLLTWFGGLLPPRLRTPIFKDLFWRLPDEK